MTNPDQEFFEFLTSKENLQGLIIAKNQFPIIKEKLIADFWNKVQRKTREAIADKPEWEVVLEENITKWYSKLYIQRKGARLFDNKLPSFIFCWQRLNQHYPYYGFWINEQTTEYDIPGVTEYIGRIQREEFPELKGYDEWFLIWEGYEEFNLADDLTLLQIIPSVMDEKAKDLSDILVELFEKVLVHYNFIEKHFKITAQS
jgi:hypothetical protein